VFAIRGRYKLQSNISAELDSNGDERCTNKNTRSKNFENINLFGMHICNSSH